MPVTPITPALPDETIENLSVRFRTVGDISCTCPIASEAGTVDGASARGISKGPRTRKRNDCHVERSETSHSLTCMFSA